MKTQNNWIKGGLILLVGILNTIGLGVFVPGIKDFAEKHNAKDLKLVGYIPFVIMALLAVMHFSGGIKPDDKKAIDETIEIVKVDTTKVDTTKVIVIDSLKK